MFDKEMIRDGVLDLGAGWYRVKGHCDGWTEEEIVDDLRRMFKTRWNLRAERYMREQLRAMVAAGSIVLAGEPDPPPALPNRQAPITSGASPAHEEVNGAHRPQPRLPGDLTWAAIESAYRELADRPPDFRHRRAVPSRPSRPELALALNISVSTLKRACETAGRGTRWPPEGL
jgi:hypothetical protein